MYNLYIYEKQMTEKRRQRSEELLQIKQKEKRKNQIKKLFSNYCKRMDNFIQSLCKKPIIIKDPNAPEDSRHPINKAASSNDKNNFIFTRFMTDKKRIALLDEKKKDVKDYEHKIMQSKNVQEKKMMQKILKDNYILQPNMIFKPRSELERIVEMKNIFGNNDIKYKKKIYEQLNILKRSYIKYSLHNENLKKIYKDVFNNEASMDNIDIDLDDRLETNSRRILKNIQIQNKKNKKNNINYNNEKKNINKHQKLIELKNNILRELFKDNEKLYFKGASQYVFNSKSRHNLNKDDNSFEAINQSSTSKSKKMYRAYSAIKIRNKKSKEIQQKLAIYKKHRPMTNVDQNIKKSGYSSIFDSSMKELENETKSKEEKKKKKNKNKKGNDFDDDEYSFFCDKKKPEDKDNTNLKEKLNYLKIISQQKPTKRFEHIKIKNNKNSKNKNFMMHYNSYVKSKESDSDEYIFIDGVKYNKKDMKSISNAIFRKCHYYHPKSTNNNSSLVDKKGKLSFTSGMSLYDFSLKYHL